MQGITPPTNPEAVMQLQFLIDPVTNRTRLGTGEVAVDSLDSATGPLTLVLKEGPKPAPARVGDRFG